MSGPDFETEHITIRRVISEGDDSVHVDWTTDANLLTLLGMVEYARLLILRGYDEDPT